MTNDLRSQIILLVAAFCLLLSVRQAPAQKNNNFSSFNPQFEIFQLPGETSGNSVQCIVQDVTGFLWFGSMDGLHRYDGHHFITYRHELYNENSLAHNYIEWIFVDSKGQLWLAHYGDGLTVFDPILEKFTRYKHDPENATSLSSNVLSMVVEDQQGYMWVGTHDGLNRFDPNTGEFHRFYHDPNDPNSLSYNLVRALYIDKNQTLWVGCGFQWDGKEGKKGGLNRYDPVTESFTRYLHDPGNPTSIADNRVRAILEDSKGNFWVGTSGNGLHLMDRSSGVFTRLTYDPTNPYKLSRPYLAQLPLSQQEVSGVTFIKEDQGGLIWIGAFNGGMNVYDPKSNAMRHFEMASPTSQLASNFVWHFCQTRDGSTWIGTGGGGAVVMKIRPNHQLFSFFQNPAFASDYWAMGILKDKDNKIWLATKGKDALLYKYDRQKDITTPYLTTTSFNELDGRDLLSLLEDKQGMIWTCNDKELIRLDPTTGKFTTFKNKPGNPHGLPPFSIEHIFQDSRGYIWLGTFGGSLHRLDPTTEKFEHFLHDPIKPGSIAGDKVRWVMEDRNGNIWAGGGCNCNDPKMPIFVDRLNAATGQFEHFETTGDVGVALCLDEDSAGNIWYSDHTHGIRMLNPTTGQIKRYNMANSGIPASAVRSLRVGVDGKIWLTTLSGLTAFDPIQEQFFSFKEPQGMKVKEMGWGTCHENSSGELFFAGRGSFIQFHPDTLKRRQAAYPANNNIVTGFKLNDILQTFSENSFLDLPAWQMKKIRLPHTQNIFSFKISNFNFSGPQPEYILENYDKSWRSDLQKGEASYFNVQPGEYTFHVRSANSLGRWNTDGTSLQIVVLPPWWKTWWAYLAYVLMVFSVGYYSYNYHLNRKLEHAEALRLRELDTFKTRLYTNITHEFRTPLTIISGMADQVRENPKDWFNDGLIMIKHNSVRLLELVNQMLDLSKLENGKMPLHLQQGDVINFLKYLTESFHSFAESRGIQLHFHTDLEGPTMDFDLEKLQQLMSNLLSNALKFTPQNGHVYVVVSQKIDIGGMKNLMLKIRDTGAGIPEDKLSLIFDRFYQVDDSSSRIAEGTGIGLALVKELIKLMDGDILVKSKPGHGTEFQIYLPIRNEASQANFSATSKLSGLSYSNPIPFPQKSFIADAPNKPLLLLAEDNADVITYLTACLSNNYRLVTAQDGQQCVDIALDIIPDLIITDVMMPQKDGFEVCQILKNHERTSHIPIIMLTARVDIESRLTGLDHGADAYLAKPFYKQELLIEIKKLLDLRKKLQKHYLMVAGLTEGSPPPKDILAMPKTEDYFVKKVRKVVETHLDDFDFSVEKLCQELHISNAHLHRKLSALTGFSATKFIRCIRLTKAKALLQNPALSVASIAYDTGFNDPSYFGRVFKQEFGITPLEWQDRQKTEKQH